MNMYTTNDGHKVRSRAEVIVDNLLFRLKIKHEYEKKITINKKNLVPDWYLPDTDQYIEFWGMENQKNYSDRQREKLKLYTEMGLTCLSLNDDDLKDSGELSERIANFIGNANKVESKELKSNLLNSCLFCKKQDKSVNDEKPLCYSCWKQWSNGEICMYCGSKVNYGFDVCLSCENNSFVNCKLCGSTVTRPRVGKPLCLSCYHKLEI